MLISKSCKQAAGAEVTLRGRAATPGGQNFLSVEVANCLTNCYNLGMRTYTLPNINREGRTCDPTELIQQIGLMNLYAISGGLWGSLRDAEQNIIGAWLPVGSGRMVEVSLDFDDTYRVRCVRRVMRGKNRNQGIIETEVVGVYCDQVGEAAYQASCWRTNNYQKEIASQVV